MNNKLQEELTARRFGASIRPDQFLIAAEVASTSLLWLDIDNLDSEYLYICWTTRHGTMSGDYKAGFTYHAPDRLVDEDDPFDSTEELVVTVDNGIEQRQDILYLGPAQPTDLPEFLAPSSPPRRAGQSLRHRVSSRRLARLGALRRAEYLRRYPGTYSIEFRPVEGFTTPPPQTFNAPSQYSAHADIYVDYVPEESTPQHGSLRVDLNVAEGRWRLRGTATWHASGEIVSNLPLGLYDVEFLDVAGWVRPAILQAHVDSPTTLVLGATYQSVPTGKGSLRFRVGWSVRFPAQPRSRFMESSG